MATPRLTDSAKFSRLSNGVAAGVGTTNCTSVDMSGYDSVTFAIQIGAVDATGVVTIHVEQSEDDSSFADLEGTEVSYTASDDNKVALLEVNRPREQYVRPVIVRSTANSVIDSVLGIQSKAGEEPVSQSATVLSTTFVHSPGEGTP